MTESLTATDHDLRDRVRHDALIGIGIHGLHRPLGMSTLSGDAAMRQLDLDYKKFCQGHSARRTKSLRTALAAYRRVIESVLALDPNAVLSNRFDGSYDRSLRSDGFWHSSYPDHFEVVHRVFLPYLPGGFRQVMIHVEISDEGQRDYVETFIEYFDGDDAGSRASFDEDLNETTRLPLDDYIKAALLDPEMVQAASEPPTYEDSRNAWKSLTTEGLQQILDSYLTLTTEGIDNPLRPGFDRDRAKMLEPKSLNAVNYCIAFLSAFTPAKIPTWGTESLTVEAELCSAAHSGRLTYGALVAAGIHLGLTSEPDPILGLRFGLSRPEIHWVSYPADSEFRRRKPRGWDVFLGRKHLFT